MPDIVAKEEAADRRDDNKEQGIEAAGSAFNVDGPNEKKKNLISRGRTERRVKTDASEKDPRSSGAAHLWPNMAPNVR